MKHHQYTNEQEQWIVKHGRDMTAKALKDAFNEKFNAEVSEFAIDQKRRKLGVNFGIKQREYTQEEEHFLRVNRNIMPMKELHRKFCERFSEIKYYALKAKVQRMGLLVDDVQKFNNVAERSRVPIGSEHRYGGYTMIKVDDKATGTKKDRRSYKENWRPKHVWVWEQHHGKLPPKHQVIFLDGDHENFNIENLAAIPLQYVVMMNRNGWIKGNPELTKTAIKLCELHYMTEGQK